MTDFLKKVLSLSAISGLAFVIEFLSKDHFLFSLSSGTSNSFFTSIAILPLLCILVLIFQKLFQSHQSRQALLCILYLLIFLFLSPRLELGLLFILGLTVLFLLEKALPPKIWVQIFLVGLGLGLLFIPALVYSLEIELSTFQMAVLLIFKSCMAMRLVSWIIDRRVYRRQSFPSLWDYLEFLFCPIFFLFPGQIQFFLFNYFHRSKGEFSSKKEFYNSCWMGVWGLSLMAIFSWGDFLFWNQIFHWPNQLQSQAQMGAFHFGTGFYWLILIYFQQTAGMAFQVCLGRFLGYQMKYDMHLPLLALSPLDYLRRHSSYVRDYIVEVGLKPLALPLLRKGIKASVVYPFAAILSYAVFVGAQTGYRPDYERPWLVTAAMIGFLCLYILLPVVKNWLLHVFGFSSQALADSIAFQPNFKPLAQWSLKDYFSWAGTLILLAISKSVLGIAKLFSQSH